MAELFNIMHFKRNTSPPPSPVENHREREKGVLVYPGIPGGLSVRNVFKKHSVDDRSLS